MEASATLVWCTGRRGLCLLHPYWAEQFPMTSISEGARSVGWRTSAVLIISRSIIALIPARPRSALGQFLVLVPVYNDWGEDVFALAIALQNIVWGIGQPLAGG